MHVAPGRGLNHKFRLLITADLLIIMTEWIKTSRGWVMRQPEDAQPVSQPTENIKSRSAAVSHDRTANVAHCVKVTGSYGKRKMSVCFSDFLKYMNLLESVKDIRRQAYVCDLMLLLTTNGLSKVSGSAQAQLFKILEAIVGEASSSEMRIVPVKQLLVCTMTTMVDSNLSIIGSKALWNRHIQTVANLSTKMEQFKFSERKEDGMPTLTDLPKEVIREIMLRLPDHRDIINLGKTCTDLYYMTQDSSLWQKLAQYHFSEKQMATFIEDTEYTDSNTSVWQHLQLKCSKKYDLRKPYTDQLVLCSACVTLHWLMQGHTCWATEERKSCAHLEPISPKDLFSVMFSTPINPRSMSWQLWINELS